MAVQKYFGPPCPHFPQRYKTEAAHQAHDKAAREYEERQRQARPRQEFESDGYPLKLKLQRLLASIKQRCQRPGRYRERGIKCLLTIEDLAVLWVRDNADTLKRPSIDRIDNDGHYSIQNCRFIELVENIRHGAKVRKALWQEART